MFLLAVSTLKNIEENNEYVSIIDFILKFLNFSGMGVEFVESDFVYLDKQQAIFYHKETVHGLTTAAGMWATAAIGMATGCRWYLISILATILIILIQCIMHMNFKVFHAHHFVKVNVVYTENGKDTGEKIREIFGVKRFTKINAKKDGEDIVYSVVISTDKIVSASDIHKIIIENDNIISIARQDDDF